MEVDPLLKSQLAWSRDYRKVPIAVINGRRVVDSSAIIDYCEELLGRDGGGGGVHLAGLSPLGSGTPRERSRREWVDSRLVRLLTPNIYRTLPEAWQASCGRRVGTADGCACGSQSREGGDAAADARGREAASLNGGTAS